MHEGDWTFRTRRYEARYWRTDFLAAAEIAYLHLGEPSWPIAVAVDIGCKKSRQGLVRKAIDKATGRIIAEAIKRCPRSGPSKRAR